VLARTDVGATGYDGGVHPGSSHLEPAPGPDAGWWTLACLALLSLAPLFTILHSLGCAVGENADERGRRVCERLDADALGWLVTAAAPLALILVVASLASRRVTFAVTAALLIAQAVLVWGMEHWGLPPDPRPS